MIIETRRLILRVPRDEDLDGWAAILGDIESARFLGGPMSRTQSWNMLAMVLGHWELRRFGYFSAILKATDECIGWAGAWFPDGWFGREVGWALRRDHWGQGLAVESTRAVLQWVSQDLQWSDVIHCIHPDNENSIALAKRVGSYYLKTVKTPVSRLSDNGERHLYGQDLSSYHVSVTELAAESSRLGH